MIQTWRSLSTFFFCTTEHCIEQHSLYNMMRVQKGAFTLPLPETFFLDPVHHCCVVVTVGSGEAVQCSALCAVGKVRCHCIFYGPGIRYSDIFGAQGIRYSVIIKLPCALLLTGHLETVHAPVADTVAYFAGLDAPVVDTVTYFGGNHRSRV